MDDGGYGETATRNTCLGVHVAQLPPFPASSRQVYFRIASDQPTRHYTVAILSD